MRNYFDHFNKGQVIGSSEGQLTLKGNMGAVGDRKVLNKKQLYPRSSSEIQEISESESQVVNFTESLSSSSNHSQQNSSKQMMDQVIMQNQYQRKYQNVQGGNFPDYYQDRIGQANPKNVGKISRYKKIQAEIDNISKNDSKQSKLQSVEIYVEKSLPKPKFGFKQEENEQNGKDRVSLVPYEDVISFDSSIQNIKNSSASLKSSKSASNFSQILKIQQNKLNIKLIKNSGFEGYIMSKIDRKQENIAKKISEIRKANQLYDQKIEEKQKQIMMVKKKIEREKNQLSVYQSKISQAFDNIDQNADSLLLSSRNFQTSNQLMNSRVQAKMKVNCNFEGISKKVTKQIIYGRCLLMQTDILDIGFDNRKAKAFELYFNVKLELLEMEIFIQNSIQNGYTLDDSSQSIKIHNIPAGKKIKIKYNVKYIGTLKDRTGLMNLKVVMKINPLSIFEENSIIPFCLYRNFLSQKSQKTQKTQKKKNMVESYNYPIVTQWQNCSEEFLKNIKSFLDNLFPSGRWIEQNVFHVDFIFRQLAEKSINILVNCRNFAIEMADTRNLDVVLCVGNFLAKSKDREKEQRGSRGKGIEN